jgi:hypothetical protein
VLRSIRVGAVEVSEFDPPDPKNFGENGTAFIGSDEDESLDAFAFLVCTPRWLTERFDDPLSPKSEAFWDEAPFRYERGPLMYWLPTVEPTTMFGTGLFLMRSWSPEVLLRSVEAACRRETANTWGTIASRLGRLMPWEYDYRWDQDQL